MAAKLRYLINEDDLQTIECILKETETATYQTDPLSKTEEYYFLRNLLQREKRELAKLCIEKEFSVNMHDRLVTDDDTPLHSAVLLQDQELIKLLLDKGASTISKNIKDETPLHVAAVMKNNDIMDMILSKFQCNVSNKDNISHLHIACIRNRVDVVKKFLQSGVDINSAVNEMSTDWPGFTSLHFAVEFRSEETVKFLVDCGANISAKDKRGFTPLHMAHNNYAYKITDIILSAQFHHPENPENPKGLSHFHIACARNNVNVMRFFIGRIEKFYSDFTTNDILKEFLLTVAVGYRSLDVVKFLIEEKIVCIDTDEKMKDLMLFVSTKKDPELSNLIMKYRRYIFKKHNCSKYTDFSRFKTNFRDCLPAGYTALHYALENDTCDPTTLRRFKSNILAKDSRGKTPLHVAFQTNQMNIVDEILLLNIEFETGYNQVDNYGLSHFHIACARNNIDVIREFLRKYVNINDTVDIESPFWPGFTALHFACHFEQLEVISFLFSRGANFFSHGLTPFDIIATKIYRKFENNDIELCKRECRQGIELLKDILSHSRAEIKSRGMTLLHIACLLNSENETRRLANPESINSRIDEDSPYWPGWTPIQFAARYGSEESMKILLDEEANTLITDATGKFPVVHVIDNLTKFKDKELAKRMIFREDLPMKKLSAWINAQTFFREDFGEHFDVVAWFLKKGKININEPRIHNMGETLLHYALEHEYKNEHIETLLEHGASVFVTDFLLRTPIFYCKDMEKREMLLDQSANVNALDWRLDNPAMKLYRSWQPKLESINVDELLILFSFGTDINHQNANGQTIFTLISRKQKPKVIIPMMKYVKSLEVLKSEYISHKNKRHYGHIMSKISESFNEDKFVRKCNHELKRMKRHNIDKNTTFYDVLTNNSFLSSRNFAKRTIQRVSSVTHVMSNKYSIYGYVLGLKCEQRLSRFDESVALMYDLTGRRFDEYTLEMICEYLKNDDMIRLIEACRGS